jgi:hypothetical protein
MLRPPSKREKRRSTNARYQARVKADRMTVVVEIGPELIDVLVRGKYLAPKEAFTRQEIGEALTRAVALMRG